MEISEIIISVLGFMGYCFLLYIGLLFVVAFLTADKKIKHKCRKANTCKLAPRCENEKEMLCYEEKK